MKFLNTILLSLVTVLIFFALIVGLGWLQTGGQDFSEIIKDIFAGNYLLFSVPIFIASLFVYGIGSYALKGFWYRLVLILLFALGFYYSLARYLITRLN